MSHVPDAWTRYLAEKAARQAADPAPLAKRVHRYRRNPLAAAQREKRRQTVIDMVKAGASTNEIATAIDRSPQQVRKIRKDLGMSRHRGTVHEGPQRRTLRLLPEWLALRQQGLSWAAIGLRYDRCGECIMQLCHRWGHLVEESREV
jgi:DNA-binding CsgD family transcriptional regulator